MTREKPSGAEERPFPPHQPLRGSCLAAARSRRGSDMPPACHSLPRRRFATLKGKPLAGRKNRTQAEACVLLSLRPVGISCAALRSIVLRRAGHVSTLSAASRQLSRCGSVAPVRSLLPSAKVSISARRTSARNSSDKRLRSRARSSRYAPDTIGLSPACRARRYRRGSSRDAS